MVTGEVTSIGAAASRCHGNESWHCWSR